MYNTSLLSFITESPSHFEVMVSSYYLDIKQRFEQMWFVDCSYILWLCVSLRISLVPRPFQHPVFEHLQYIQKWEGERPGPFYHLNDVLST